MNANGSVTLQGFARKVVRHVELIIDKPSHGSERRETPRRSVFGRFSTIHKVCRGPAKNLKRRRLDFLRRHHCLLVSLLALLYSNFSWLCL